MNQQNLYEKIIKSAQIIHNASLQQSNYVIVSPEYIRKLNLKKERRKKLEALKFFLERKNL
jgi:creatinine amidohydrolase/Fe(II)-dependent formamide hydrolase-like protein